MDKPRLARDIMATNLVTVRPEAHVYDGIRVLLQNGITGAPVVDAERNYLGVLSEKCCLSVLSITAGIATDVGMKVPDTRASEFMTRKLVTLRPENDAVVAIELLLRHRVSGAPVTDEHGKFLGVFSEKFSMQVLLEFVFHQIPSAQVGPFMNTDFGRVVRPDTPVLDIAKRFLDTPYRRLPVVENEQLLGQISRRDVLRARHHLSAVFESPSARLLVPGKKVEISDASREVLESAQGSAEVGAFMDRKARTIDPETDFLQIAHVFNSTNYRRLPVVENDKLVGQVSRRDVLVAAHRLLTTAPRPEQAFLYLSGVVEPGERPSFRYLFD